jgi:hypothetical protein
MDLHRGAALSQTKTDTSKTSVKDIPVVGGILNFFKELLNASGTMKEQEKREAPRKVDPLDPEAEAVELDRQATELHKRGSVQAKAGTKAAAAATEAIYGDNGIVQGQVDTAKKVAKTGAELANRDNAKWSIQGVIQRVKDWLK